MPSKKKRRYIPYWMRYRCCCPNCGFESKESDYAKRNIVKVRTPNTLAIHDTIVIHKCPRCGYVPGEEDELTEPWRKDADLSEE